MSTNMIIIIVLALINIFFIFWLLQTEKRLKRLFRGSKAINLEEIIEFIGNEIKVLQKAKGKMESNVYNIDQRLKRNVKSVEIIRFNPFKESGGNQSFSMALVDEKGNGIVFTSLYSRENVSIYAKPIENYASGYELTVEEKEVLKRVQLS